MYACKPACEFRNMAERLSNLDQLFLESFMACVLDCMSCDVMHRGLQQSHKRTCLISNDSLNLTPSRCFRWEEMSMALAASPDAVSSTMRRPLKSDFSRRTNSSRFCMPYP